ncbi:MAG: NAD(P)H-dependent oxidoreductase subunit E [Thermofilum sp.]|jgi:NADH-quinone oxidoreductase subunit E|nr:NAD(P)H-dependent oxidoreductase subunit E [Thermofilum sp.]
MEKLEGSNEVGALPDKVFEGVPKAPYGLLEALRRVQAVYGYLPLEGMRRAAEYVGVPLAQAYSVATFYHQYSLEPIGSYRFIVCTGLACYLKGNSANIEFLRALLELKPGQKTTKDGLFSVEETSCLGCCSLAPVVVVEKPEGSSETLGKVDPSTLRMLVERYREQGGGGER